MDSVPSLLDFFAALASEEDIKSVKHLVKETNQVRKDSNGRCYTEWGIPNDWRQQARYLHAARMVEARKD